MHPSLRLAVCFVTLSFWGLASNAADPKPDSGTIELFNGKDLTGWGYKSGEKFDGKKESDDGRLRPRTARSSSIQARESSNSGRRPNSPRTSNFGSNSAAVNADSGLFLRDPQLQMHNYPVAGPYKNLKKYKPQDWNEIVVTVKDNVAHCTCNGEVLENTLKLPATGGIGLEADRGQMEYRNLRLTENK